MKVSELTGAALDWAVAKCEGLEVYFDDGVVCLKGQPFDDNECRWLPTRNWAQGGPIIEREVIGLEWGPRLKEQEWFAWTPAPEQAKGQAQAYGPTPLIAAMRCYVASKLGDEIEVPDELLETA